ncbi:hypothetical protein KCU96_g41, partial [Aureobasidium melanogenum]
MHVLILYKGYGRHVSSLETIKILQYRQLKARSTEGWVFELCLCLNLLSLPCLLRIGDLTGRSVLCHLSFYFFQLMSGTESWGLLTEAYIVLERLPWLFFSLLLLPRAVDNLFHSLQNIICS